MNLSPEQIKQRSAAGLASAAARREMLGQHVYRMKMQELGQAGGLKGGRPNWRRSLEKARERMTRR